MSLADALAQHAGIAPVQAGEALKFLVLFGVVTPDSLQRAERDARIYEMRASMTEADLSQRFELDPRRIRQIMRAQLSIRRAGNKEMPVSA